MGIDQNNEKRYPQVADIWYQIIKKIEMLQLECKSDSFPTKTSNPTFRSETR